MKNNCVPFIVILFCSVTLATSRFECIVVLDLKAIRTVFFCLIGIVFISIHLFFEHKEMTFILMESTHVADKIPYVGRIT